MNQTSSHTSSVEEQEISKNNYETEQGKPPSTSTTNLTPIPQPFPFPVPHSINQMQQPTHQHNYNVQKHQQIFQPVSPIKPGTFPVTATSCPNTYKVPFYKSKCGPPYRKPTPVPPTSPHVVRTPRYLADFNLYQLALAKLAAENQSVDNEWKQQTPRQPPRIYEENLLEPDYQVPAFVSQSYFPGGNLQMQQPPVSQFGYKNFDDAEGVVGNDGSYPNQGFMPNKQMDMQFAEYNNGGIPDQIYQY